MAELPALSAEDFRRLCEFLYRRTGMVFTEAKRYYVDRRINERMLATGSASFASYFARLRTDVDQEIEQLINAFTVNETYFYREDHQLQCLTTDLLAECLRERRPEDGIRIWCAPCSTGEEPYSVAIWLLENWPLVDRYEIEILGSDIDTQALQACEAGIFGKRALMRLSPELIERYFEPLPDEHWRILEELRQSVQFSRVNLVEATETRPHGQFDVIFCRNVLIYFDDASRRVAAENLFENLRPGGFICLGHTESMSRISPLFEVRRFADAIVYQRPYRERAMAEPKTVLVIDDAGLVRMYYRTALEQAGFRVEEALNGLEALEKLPDLAPDLLVVDVNMPQMDGFSFLKKLRQAEPTIAGIPALVTSTEARATDFAAARAAGANYYLVKPIDRETLVAFAGMLSGVPR